MPFDPDNPDVFREILRTIAGRLFLTSAKMIDLVHENRSGRKHEGRGPFDLTRSALDRFKQGQRIKNIRGLRELWMVLETHEDTTSFFPKSDRPAISWDASLLSALPRFFAENGREPSYDLAVLGDRIAGSYVMYRPDWRPRIPSGLARASLVQIDHTGAGFSISETQDFPQTADEPADWQHDVGVMASFARYIYFLMREEKSPGTAVKFGLVDALFPFNGSHHVNWFRGVLFVSSNLAIFPLAKFFCRRVSEANEVQGRVMRIADIEDGEAKAYLSEPFRSS